MANANQSQPQVTYDQIRGLFDIKDMNDKIIVPPDANVFSTNVFIPMEGKIDHKTYFYLSGMVKLVETFQERINNSGLKDQGWMLFIYYDSMFDVDSEYNNSVYNTKNNNNNTNKDIKTNYDSNKEQLKQLLQLYKNYLKIIKLNIGGKYSFVKLYSFNCSSITRKGKGKGYLGHPSTFGSMVRFIPMFNPEIKRMFCINISHAISPRLCYLISEWIKSDKLLLTSGLNYYKYDDTNYKTSIIMIELEHGPAFINLFNYRIPAGLFGFYKNEEIDIFQKRSNKFYNSMNKLIELYNRKPKFYLPNNENVFSYGIDEIILGYLFNNLKTDNLSNNVSNKQSKLDKILFYNMDDKHFNKSFFHEFGNYNSKSTKLLNNKELKTELIDKLASDPFSLKENIRIGGKGPNDDSIQIQIKYNPKLTKKELDSLKIKIDEYVNFILSKLIIDGKINSNLDPEENTNIINFLKLYLKKMYCDDSVKKCRELYSNKKFIEQLKFLDLYQGDLFNCLGENLHFLTRYNSRIFFKSIEQDQSIKTTLGAPSTNITGLYGLLDSYDEEKPLIIFSKNDTVYYYDFIKNFPEYFTFMDSDHPRLLCELLKYYKDPAKVLRVPYVMLPEVQVGGKRKMRTIKKSKKSKQSKSIKRKITKTKNYKIT